MKAWPLTIFLSASLVAAAACKRQELELTDTTGIVLPGTADFTAAQDIDVERQENAKAQASLDLVIATLEQKLESGENLSTAQKNELIDKINLARTQKATLVARAQELEDKWAAAQKALEDARKRNEQLQKELDEKNQQTANGADGSNGTVVSGTDGTGTQSGDATASAGLGPFTLFKGDQCLQVKDQSLADGALITSGTCKTTGQQSFTFYETDPTGLYRIKASGSGKCFAVQGSSAQAGAKLMQTACVDGDVYQQFYILGINDADFLLQNLKSQLCFAIQADKSLAQVNCDVATATAFRVNKVAQ